MEAAGLINSIISANSNIDSGRKGFATKGKEQEGRISYETGIASAMLTFQEAQATADPQIIILAEFTFLSQELHLCDRSDKDSIDSLTKAIESFEDAFLALKAAEGFGYITTDMTFPHHKKYRVKNYPKDSYHIAFISHRTRLKNILRAPGIRPSADCVRVRKSPFETAACKSDNCTERVFGKAEEGS